MTFQDIFKSSFLENVTAVSLLDMAIALALAFAVGVFIFFVYKKTYKGVMYSSTFGVTLIALTMIATLVILAVTSNVVLSLGMVGALSIVRFRSAIKDPLDIAFLFWAIGAGIVLAAGLIPLGVIGSLLIGAVLLLFVNHKSNDQPYMAVIRPSGGHGVGNPGKGYEKTGGKDQEHLPRRHRAYCGGAVAGKQHGIYEQLGGHPRGIQGNAGEL